MIMTKRLVHFSIFVLFFLVGCEETILYHHILATYDDIKDQSRYGHINVHFEELDGKVIYSFVATSSVYDLKYEILSENGTFKVEVFDANELLLCELGGEENKQVAISQDTNRIRIVVYGEKASGNVIIRW